MKKVVQLFTPGLDSYLANFFLTKQVEKGEIELHRLYFDLKSRYSKNEIEFLTSFYSPDFFKILDTLNIEKIESEDAHVPNRNLLMVTMAAANFPDVDTIYINGMKDDRVSDNKKEFFEKVSKVLSLSMERDVTVTSLFWEKEKTQAINEFINEGGPRIDLATKTYSCFETIAPTQNIMIFERNHTQTHGKPMDIPNLYSTLGTLNIHGCRHCAACFRRFCALTSANIYVPFLNTDMVKDYVNGKVDEDEHPHRFISVQSYAHFVKKCDQGEI